jgi:hypothetical protein
LQYSGLPPPYVYSVKETDKAKSLGEVVTDMVHRSPKPFHLDFIEELRREGKVIDSVSLYPQGALNEFLQNQKSKNIAKNSSVWLRQQLNEFESFANAVDCHRKLFCHLANEQSDQFLQNIVRKNVSSISKREVHLKVRAMKMFHLVLDEIYGLHFKEASSYWTTITKRKRIKSNPQTCKGALWFYASALVMTFSAVEAWQGSVGRLHYDASPANVTSIHKPHYQSCLVRYLWTDSLARIHKKNKHSLPRLGGKNQSLLGLFKRMFLDAKLVSNNRHINHTSLLDELVLEDSYRKKVSTYKQVVLRYGDPEANPFRFIFHKGYTPLDFAVDVIENLLAIGCNPIALKDMIDNILKESASLCPPNRVYSDLMYPGDECTGEKRETLPSRTFLKDAKIVSDLLSNRLSRNVPMDLEGCWSDADVADSLLHEFISVAQKDVRYPQNTVDYQHSMKEDWKQYYAKLSKGQRPRRSIQNNRTKRQTLVRKRHIKGQFTRSTEEKKARDSLQNRKMMITKAELRLITKKMGLSYLDFLERAVQLGITLED